MRLPKCGWTECPDCRNRILPFADEDESILTRHNEELIIGPLPGAASQKGHSGALLTRTEVVQADTAPPRCSTRLTVATKPAAIAPKLDIPVPAPRTTSSQSVVTRGKAAFTQKQLVEKEAAGSSRVTRGQAKIGAQRLRTAESTVESREPNSSLADADARRVRAPEKSVEQCAPVPPSVPVRARAMPVPTDEVVEQSKPVYPMTTRGRNVSSTDKLPTRFLNEPRVLEQKAAKMGCSVPSTKAKRMCAPTEIVEQDVSVPKVVKGQQE